ncbi:hypothetical protein [Geomonas anaerohicana]|uniref:Uncharacterized protein n=1 Tax=Geomonas anaerohicana TaxID=2798583 RepID=A0ABS0YBF5_9BACT|nr:hypothetical protein [Geomonas anaerohicana]MBJ6749474.1 hypothetical protein [Geomonas anaerohicana]
MDLSSNDNLELEVLEHIVAHREAILFSKDLLWQYENEYRFVSISSDSSEFEVDISGSLVGIFTSYNFPDCYKLNLLSIIEKFDIYALRIEWEFGVPLITQWPSRDGS